MYTWMYIVDYDLHLPVSLISSVYRILPVVSKPLPVPGLLGSYEALRGPQSWGCSHREQWGREGQRSQAEGRNCDVVQLHMEALHD